jgi:hypothetical protein
MTQPDMGQNMSWRGICSYRRGFHGSLLPTSLRATQARDGDLNPAQEGTLRLLCGGDAEDVLQLAVHLVHPVCGGCKQCLQKRDRCGHVLTGPGKGKALCPLTVVGGGDVPGLSLGVGKVNYYDPLYLRCGLAVM